MAQNPLSHRSRAEFCSKRSPRCDEDSGRRFSPDCTAFSLGLLGLRLSEAWWDSIVTDHEVYNTPIFSFSSAFYNCSFQLMVLFHLYTRIEAHCPSGKQGWLDNRTSIL